MRDTKRFFGVEMCGTQVWLWVFADALIEFVDPTMDGQQVGAGFNTQNSVDHMFRESWKCVCTPEGLIPLLCPAYWGIARSLLIVYGFTFTIPLLVPLAGGKKFMKTPFDHFSKFADEKYSQDEVDRELAYFRQTRWGAGIGIAETLNMPLVGHLFNALYKEEAEQYNLKFPFPKASVFLWCRITGEALPMFWLQISLVALTLKKNLQKGDWFTIGMGFFSLFTSAKSIVSTWIESVQEWATGSLLETIGWTAYASWGYNQNRLATRNAPTAVQLNDTLDRSGKREVFRNTHFNIGSGSGMLICCQLFIVIMPVFVVCIIRLIGIFMCESHIYNISQVRSFSNLTAGCFTLTLTRDSISNESIQQ